MSDALQDETTSIRAIYGENTLTLVSEAPLVYALSLPAIPTVSLRIEYPNDYPDAPPSILGTQSVHDAAKGEGQQIVDVVRSILAEVYMAGAPCMYELIEEADQRLQQLGLDQGTRFEEQQAAQANGQHPEFGQPTHSSSDFEQSLDALGESPQWTLSEVITEKKSVFVARAAAVTSVDQAKHCLAHLISTDKRVAKATHNISAWRIKGENGVQYQDCDDDGETAAGGRVLHLLELMEAWDVMVVVTRWYGGVQLGPDRFRLINQTARDAVVKGGYVEDAAKIEKHSHKRKGKK